MSQTMPASFDELIQKHELPVLVDFWAPWCGPCKMVAPVLQELAGQWKGRITIIKINTDEKPDIAARFQITGIPTLILFKNGQPVHRISGALSLEQMKQQVQTFL
ncbi:MAG: thioredoxin [Planctomycetes bacterium]|nr:thioredoxin [Planctomycetota bacterium]